MRIIRNKDDNTTAAAPREAGWARRGGTPSLVESFGSIAVTHGATPWR